MKLKDEERQRCEVWTRVMGYHRPTDSFNVGKKSEHKERTFFEENTTDKSNIAEQYILKVSSIYTEDGEPFSNRQIKQVIKDVKKKHANIFELLISEPLDFPENVRGILNEAIRNRGDGRSPGILDPVETTTGKVIVFVATIGSVIGLLLIALVAN